MKKVSWLYLLLCWLLTLSLGIPGNLNAEEHQLTFTVLTFNIWSGLDYEGTLKMGEYETGEHRQKRFEILVRKLQQLRPDVICLQEVNYFPETARKIARAIKYQAYGYVGLGGIHVGPIGLPVNLREADVILVSPDFKVTSLGREQLSGEGFSTNWITFHFDEINQVMGLRLEKEGVTFDVFNTHLHAGPGLAHPFINPIRKLWQQQKIGTAQYRVIYDEFQRNQNRRIREIRNAVNFIQRVSTGEDPIIFAGDFNMVPNSRENVALTSLGFTDTWKADRFLALPTWDPQTNRNIIQYYTPPAPDASVLDKVIWEVDIMKVQRIDYIWTLDFENSMTMVEAGLFGTEAQNGVHPSDHFGYFATFRMTQ